MKHYTLSTRQAYGPPRTDLGTRSYNNLRTQTCGDNPTCNGYSFIVNDIDNSIEIENNSDQEDKVSNLKLPLIDGDHKLFIECNEGKLSKYLS